MRRSLPMAVTLAAALSVAACGGSSDSSGGSATATISGSAATTSGSAAPSDAVAWLDKVCGEIVALSEAETAPPPDLSNPDPAQALKAFDNFVARHIDLVEEKIRNLRNAGDSPIQGGGEALTALLNGLEALKNGYQTARDKFATIDPRDTQAAQAVIVEVFTGLSQGSAELEKAFEEIGSNQEIKDASSKAPNCQKLDSEMSSSTAATTTS